MNLRDSIVPHQHLEPYLQSEAEYLNKNYAMTDNAFQFSKSDQNLSLWTVWVNKIAIMMTLEKKILYFNQVHCNLHRL